jgi:hypothetical protein
MTSLFQKNLISTVDIISDTVTANIVTANIVADTVIANTVTADIVTANSFIGDGGLLSNIILTTIENGTSNVSVPVADGNITAAANGIQVINVGYNGNTYVSIGGGAGLGSSTDRAVYIGSNAGSNSTTGGSTSVAIGHLSGRNSTGNASISIGGQSGNAQGVGAIAIGLNASFTGPQGGNAIAIGSAAGNVNQGLQAIAIGRRAGVTNQGANSIAIGQGAGSTNQPPNSIILNAQLLSDLNASQSGFYVAPVRQDNANVNDVMFYNTVTKELTYSPGGSKSFNAFVTPTISIPSNTQTAVLFTIGLDPNNWYDAATGRFQPTISGQYLINCLVTWNPSSGTGDYRMSMALFRTGTPFQTFYSPGDYTSSVSQNLTIITNLNGTTDYVEVIVNTTTNAATQGISSGAFLATLIL